MSLRALNAALAASGSATAVLEEICLGSIHIRRLPTPTLPSASLEAPTLHRHVELVHDERTLSTAHLWYRPLLLPPDMLAALAETDAPFGRIVQPLNLHRETLRTRLGVAGDPVALEHHALLILPDGQPLAEVLEYYSWTLVSDGG